MQPQYYGSFENPPKFPIDRIIWFRPNRDESGQSRTNAWLEWYLFMVELDIKHPADLDDEGVRYSLINFGLDVDDLGLLRAGSRELIRVLKSFGYDSLSIQMGALRHYAIFHPKQVIAYELDFWNPPVNSTTAGKTP